MADAPLILSADDDEGWRELVARWLKGAGYRVAQCSRGRDVIPLARRERPDAFVLDHDMGHEQGGDVCAEIKADPELKAVPVVILTTLAQEMLLVAKWGKPDQFVVKSDHSDELLDTLERLLGPRAQGRQR